MPKKKDAKPILYEMMYILDPSLGEDGIEKMNETIKERLTGAGATIEKDQPWGVRRLAYELKKRKEGYYHVLEFTAPSTVPPEFNTWSRTQAALLRHLIIKVPKSKILQEKRDAAAAAQAAERAREAQAAQAAKEEAAAAEAAPSESTETPKSTEPDTPVAAPASGDSPAVQESRSTEEEKKDEVSQTETEEQPVSSEADQEEEPSGTAESEDETEKDSSSAS